ncbi:MAG: TfoX/Sxy family protein [Actinomycetota bacterium]|nr:TfoX/Sxy family protein [Actinomycetota bacterium]
MTDVDRVLELIDGSTARRMFGGQGIYAEGKMFAVAYDERIYLKVDDESRAEFEELGSGPFRPNERQTLRSFYELPDAIAADDAELAAWLHRAIEATKAA